MTIPLSHQAKYQKSNCVENIPLHLVVQYERCKDIERVKVRTSHLRDKKDPCEYKDFQWKRKKLGNLSKGVQL